MRAGAVRVSKRYVVAAIRQQEQRRALGFRARLAEPGHGVHPLTHLVDENHIRCAPQHFVPDGCATVEGGGDLNPRGVAQRQTDATDGRRVVNDQEQAPHPPTIRQTHRAVEGDISAERGANLPSRRRVA